MHYDLTGRTESAACNREIILLIGRSDGKFEIAPAKIEHATSRYFALSIVAQ